jgi:hypothetical protein
MPGHVRVAGPAVPVQAAHRVRAVRVVADVPVVIGGRKAAIAEAAGEDAAGQEHEGRRGALRFIYISSQCPRATDPGATGSIAYPPGSPVSAWLPIPTMYRCA